MTKISAFYAKYGGSIRKFGFFAAVAAGAFIAVRVAWVYAAPFVAGFLLAALLEPLARFLTKRLRLPRGVAAAFLVVVAVSAVSVLIGFVAVKLASQARNLADNMPVYAAEFAKTTSDIAERAAGLTDFLPERWRDFAGFSGGDILSTATASLAGWLGNGVGKGGVNAVKQIPGVIVFVILTVLSTFFFIKDRKLIYGGIERFFDRFERVRDVASLTKNGVLSALAGYCRAQLMIMSVTSSIAILGLAILHYQYAFLIGLTIGIVDAFPILGSGAIIWPWALYSLLAGRYGFAAGLMVVYGLIFVTRQVLEPKVLGSQIGLHPLAVLTSIYAGVKLFGAAGIIVGPLICVCIKIAVQTSRTPKAGDGGGGGEA